MGLLEESCQRPPRQRRFSTLATQAVAQGDEAPADLRNLFDRLRSMLMKGQVVV